MNQEESTVQTFAIPPEEDRTDPVDGQPLASPNAAIPATRAQNSALSSPVQQQSSDTPVEGQRANTQGDGAEPSYRGPDPMTDSGKKPDTMIEDSIYSDPKGFDERVQATVEAIQKQRTQAGDKTVALQRQLLNEQLGVGDGEATRETVLNPETGKIANGINAAEAAGKISKSEAKQKRFALKNIYKVIKPEEMGLFLIDFGLRAMMAGESMGDLGALGAAGSGAMGALQERRRYAEEQRIAAEQRGVEAGERAAKDYETAAGIVQKNRELDIDEKRASALGRPYSGLQKFQLDLARSVAERQGRDPQEAEAEMLAIFQGEDPPNVQRQYWMKHFADLVAEAKSKSQMGGNVTRIYQDSNGKNYADYNKDDIKAAANEMIVYGSGVSPLQRALNGASEE